MDLIGYGSFAIPFFGEFFDLIWAPVQTVLEAARDLGMHVRGVSTAGVGDINLVAKLGATCIDGVGPEGGSFHTSGEFLLVDSIARRAAMNAAALRGCLADLALS